MGIMKRVHPAHAKIQGHPLFRDFDPEELDELLELADPRLFHAGLEIYRQGDLGHAMFVIVEGDARAVAHYPDGTEIEVGRYGVGEMFGEMALLGGRSRQADVVAMSDCMVMTITTGLVKMLGHAAPRAGFKLAMALLDIAGRRLRAADQRYSDSINIVSALAADGTVMMEQKVA